LDYGITGAFAIAPEKQKELSWQGVEPSASYLKLGKRAEIPESCFLCDTKAQPLRAGEAPAKPSPDAKRPVPSITEMCGSIEVVVVSGGTKAYWSGGDFSHITGMAVDK
jgi:hypothetical protein